ncbi:hypothetical protein LCGC14_2974670, partial [marine sediment metagenome]
MELDYRDILAKMRELAAERKVDIMSTEDQDRLLAAAVKELSAPVATSVQPLVVGAADEPGCDCEVKEGEKCPHDMLELAPKPFGGATSFSDHDEYQDAIDTELHVKELGFIFRMLVDNIFSDEEMTLPQKADAVMSAATELSTRVKTPPPQAG